MNWRIVYLSIMLIGCQEKEINNNVSSHKSENISLLISRGGREVIWEEREKLIPDSLSDEMYLFELDTIGKLSVSYGFGKQIVNSIKMNLVETTQSVTLHSVDLDSIFQLANRIYQDKEYQTQNSPTDSWFVRLKIDNKIFNYYLGESLHSLNANYLDLVDKMVIESPIKVKDYR